MNGPQAPEALRQRADEIEGALLIQRLRELERLAIRHQDGHLTLMRFTTHWKAFIGTPAIDLGMPTEPDFSPKGDYGFIRDKVSPGGTLSEAVAHAVKAGFKCNILARPKEPGELEGNLEPLQ